MQLYARRGEAPWSRSGSPQNGEDGLGGEGPGGCGVPTVTGDEGQVAEVGGRDTRQRWGPVPGARGAPALPLDSDERAKVPEAQTCNILLLK